MALPAIYLSPSVCISVSCDSKAKIRGEKISLYSKPGNFYFYPQLLELIAKSQLTSLSGIAQKNFMNILEKVVLKGELSLSLTPFYRHGDGQMDFPVEQTCHYIQGNVSG